MLSLKFAVTWKAADSAYKNILLIKHRFLLQDHSLHPPVAAVIFWPLPFSVGLMAVIVTHLHFRCCYHAVIMLWYCTSKSPVSHLGLLLCTSFWGSSSPTPPPQLPCLDVITTLTSGAQRKAKLPEVTPGNPALYLLAQKNGKTAEEAWKLLELKATSGYSPKSLS